jgi:N-formylglutamate amidohydrolase
VVQTCIEIDSWSAPAHSKLPAVEDGPHLGGDAIQGIKEQLQADRQNVRKSLLDADMHIGMGKGWGRSQARASE